MRVAGVAYRGAVRHVFTHRDVTAELFRVEVDASGPAAPDRRWVSPAAIGAIGVSSFARKTVEIGPRTKHRNARKCRKPSKVENGTTPAFRRSKKGW